MIPDRLLYDSDRILMNLISISYWFPVHLCSFSVLYIKPLKFFVFPAWGNLVLDESMHWVPSESDESMHSDRDWRRILVRFWLDSVRILLGFWKDSDRILLWFLIGFCMILIGFLWISLAFPIDFQCIYVRFQFYI